MPARNAGVHVQWNVHRQGGRATHLPCKGKDGVDPLAQLGRGIALLGGRGHLEAKAANPNVHAHKGSCRKGRVVGGLSEAPAGHVLACLNRHDAVQQAVQATRHGVTHA